jgi:hypothetical protein
MSLFPLFVIRANDGWKIVEMTLFVNIKHSTNKKAWMTTTTCNKPLKALYASNVVQGTNV